MAHPEQFSDHEEYFTYADYLEWDEGERTELIYGTPFQFPFTEARHQRVSMQLSGQIYMYEKGLKKKIAVYMRPLAVRLFERKGDRPQDVDTVVEPDIFAACDRNQLDEYGCVGAPDFIIEILSRSTEKHDRYRKRNLYEAAGVREYWIADPETKTVTPYVLVDGRYQAGEPSGETLTSAVLEGFTADLRAVFAE